LRLRFEFSTSQTQVHYFKDTTNYSEESLAEIFKKLYFETTQLLAQFRKNVAAFRFGI